VKLHDLRPAAGSRRARTRVGRGIAAGQGKTAGRGTKGQRARAGASIPAWFEGGQTPIHIRVPKLHGFKNLFKIHYAVVNVGQISVYAEAGRFGVEMPTAKGAKAKAAEGAPVTVNAEVLAQAGLIRGDGKPLKVLGQGDVAVKLFVAADRFSASARSKIEAAGGFVQLLAPEVPAASEAPAAPEASAASEAKVADADSEAPAAVAELPAEEPEAPTAELEAPAAAAEPEAAAEPVAKPARKRPATAAKKGGDES
jgi:large subunit ribosomal protein L15